MEEIAADMAGLLGALDRRRHGKMNHSAVRASPLRCGREYGACGL